MADYVDFYSSEQHATNVGRIFRPDAPALPPDWKHLPIGYHGRAGTVVVSGTPVRPAARHPRRRAGYGPSERLDIEAEVGFVVGTPSPLGEPVRAADSREHVFGVVLVNDWCARDIQSLETRRSGRSSASRSPPRSRPGWCRSPRWSRRSSTRRRRTRARWTTCSRPARRSTWPWRCG